MTATPNLMLPEFGSVGVPSGSDLTRGMRRLDALVQLTAFSFETAPPSNPVLGDRYIVSSPATGAFAGHELHVAAYEQAGWVFYVPRNDWIALVAGNVWRFDEDAGAWEKRVFVPAGGSPGDVLTKTSATDYAMAWVAGGGAGGDPASGYEYFTDCDYGMFGASAGGGQFALSNAGTGSNTLATAVDGHPGVISGTTGTSNTGRSGAIVGFSGASETTWLILGTDALIFDALIQIPTLPDGTNTFEFAIGFLGRANGSSTSGVVAKVAWNGSAAIWRLTGISSGSSTNADATSGPTASTWHYVKLEATSTGAELFIDGVSVATLSTGLPSAGFSLGYHIIKSAGTTARTALIDFMRARQTFGTSRF